MLLRLRFLLRNMNGWTYSVSVVSGGAKVAAIADAAVRSEETIPSDFTDCTGFPWL
jgi:hypothetical protein